ncbi:Cullin [Mycena floridula]|nr:Cullin [Mycena floridula]
MSATTTTYSATLPDTDLASTWPFLEEGVDHIMTKLQTSGLAYSRQLTTIARATSRSATGQLNKDNRGASIYSGLTVYFSNHLAPIREHAASLQGLPLLRYYVTEWARYTKSSDYIHRLFTYLNRHWVTRQRTEGRRTYQVYTLALSQWKLAVFDPIQAKEPMLTKAILDLIEQHRDGELVDQSLLKSVIESFVSLGLDPQHPENTCLEVYRMGFETPFLDATDRYYCKESEAFLARHSIPEYVQKVEERLRQEADRVDRYLNSHTTRALIWKCESILIQKHTSLMADYFPHLLQADREEDIRRMYSVLSRVVDGLNPLREQFATHVKSSGLTAVSRLVGDDPDNLDPKAYVDTLLGVHAKNRDTVVRCCRGEAGFMASLDQAVREFVNYNVVTGTSTSKSPELLARHTDLLLRKSNKAGEQVEMEEALDRMILFRYIDDKDVFQEFYRTKLSKRLIHGVSHSEEGEASMISKLKQACGFEYTNKLQRMFTDMSLSRDLTDQFKERMQQSHQDTDLTFTVMVLGTNFWPLIPPRHEFVIPKEILPTHDRFHKYYQSKHSGRKLTWLWNYCKNELRTNYLTQSYILMTSSYQMGVLLLYNDNDTLTLEEIAAATSIPKDLLIQILAILSRAKILINEESDHFDLNPSFKSKKIRINLNQPIKAEVKQETKDVIRSVDEDRKYLIQATIVRIMKARKTMKNQALVQEVISQISQRFAPKIPDIKKAIETLLEKEYIERVGDTKETFSYVA